MTRSSRKIILRPATMADAAKMAPHLRPADQLELAALSNRSHETTLRLSVAVSDDPLSAVTADSGELVAMLGVGRPGLLSTTGIPWMLGTPTLEKLGRQIMELSAEKVGAWRREYPLLVNHVYAEHQHSIRWLKWLGFTLHPAAPYGPFGNPFHKFEMRS